MLRKGFLLIDRTLEVKIPLNGKIDFERYKQPDFFSFSEKASAMDYTRIKEIAKKSFTNDSRFYVTFDKQRKEVADSILEHWLEQLEKVFAIQFQGQIIGFADIHFPKEFHEMPFFN